MLKVPKLGHLIWFFRLKPLVGLCFSHRITGGYRLCLWPFWNTTTETTNGSGHDVHRKILSSFWGPCLASMWTLHEFCWRHQCDRAHHSFDIPSRISDLHVFRTSWGVYWWQWLDVPSFFHDSLEVLRQCTFWSRGTSSKLAYSWEFAMIFLRGPKLNSLNISKVGCQIGINDLPPSLDAVMAISTQRICHFFLVPKKLKCTLQKQSWKWPAWSLCQREPQNSTHPNPNMACFFSMAHCLWIIALLLNPAYLMMKYIHRISGEFQTVPSDQMKTKNAQPS